MNQAEPSTRTNGIVQQAMLELEIIGHVREALAAVVQADFHECDLARKLGALHFVLESFQRHVERLFALEEQSGYMPALSESHPHLADTVNRLRRQHEGLNKAIQRLVARVDAITPSSVAEFDVLCKDIARVTDQLVAHTHAETKLLQDAYEQDTGGEG